MLNTVFYLIFAAIFVLLLFFCSAFGSRKGDAWLERILKISTVVFLTLSMLDVFLPDLFMCSHEPDSLKKMSGTVGHAILRWLNMVSFTILPIAVYQKNKYFEKLASFFCLPVAIVNVAFFYKYIGYFTEYSNSGLQTVRVIPQFVKDFLVNDCFRAVFFGLTCLSQLLALVILTWRNREKLAVKKGEMKKLILIFFGVTYMSLPVFVPQYLFGHVNIMMTRFSPTHIAWMIAIVAIIVALYFVFRNQSYEARYLLVLSMSWALMMQFSQMFTASAELNVMKLPLQLCNLGSYLALIMLLTKNVKIYHFALAVNVVGAIIAIMILDISADISHLSRLWVVHYIVEHTKVLIVPILCFVLRIFEPVDKKLLKHFSIGFTVYYAVVFVIGTLSNGFYRMCEGNEDIQNFFYANHLFMFDKDIAKNLLGFTDPLFENCVIKLGAFEIYPLVQVLVYVAFMVLCLGVCLIYYALSGNHRKAEPNKHN